MVGAMCGLEAVTDKHVQGTTHAFASLRGTRSLEQHYMVFRETKWQPSDSVQGLIDRVGTPAGKATASAPSERSELKCQGALPCCST